MEVNVFHLFFNLKSHLIFFNTEYSYIEIKHLTFFLLSSPLTFQCSQKQNQKLEKYLTLLLLICAVYLFEIH